MFKWIKRLLPSNEQPTVEPILAPREYVVMLVTTKDNHDVNLAKKYVNCIRSGDHYDQFLTRNMMSIAKRLPDEAEYSGMSFGKMLNSGLGRIDSHETTAIQGVQFTTDRMYLLNFTNEFVLEHPLVSNITGCPTEVLNDIVTEVAITFSLQVLSIHVWNRYNVQVLLKPSGLSVSLDEHHTRLESVIGEINDDIIHGRSE